MAEEEDQFDLGPNVSSSDDSSSDSEPEKVSSSVTKPSLKRKLEETTDPAERKKIKRKIADKAKKVKHNSIVVGDAAFDVRSSKLELMTTAEQRKYFVGLLAADVPEYDGTQTLESVHFVEILDYANPKEHTLRLLPVKMKRSVPHFKDIFGFQPRANSPSALVLTFSALRAVDMVRACRNIGGGGNNNHKKQRYDDRKQHRHSNKKGGNYHNKQTVVGKFFARHMNKNDQKQSLNRGVNIGVGTPHRLHQLCQDGALNFEHTKLLVIDCGLDKKGMGFFSSTQIRQEFMKMFHTYVMKQADLSQLKLWFY